MQRVLVRARYNIRLGSDLLVLSHQVAYLLVSSGVPLVELHRSLLVEMLVHVK